MTGSKGEIFLTALTTEHFVTQTAIAASVNEQQARASMYLLAVSGGLIAMGFMARTEYLLLFVAAVLAVLFVAGLLTIFRLVEIGLESAQSQVVIARIRERYRSLGIAPESDFRMMHDRWPDDGRHSGGAGRVLGILTTAASMIACVNAFIGGALVSLVSFNALGLTLTLSVWTGAVFALLEVTFFGFYQARRIKELIAASKTAGAGGEEGARP